MQKQVLMSDLSAAYDQLGKMLQYNFNYENFENLTNWLKSMWVIIETKRDEWMKERDLYAKFEVEHNRIEKEVDKKMKKKSDPDYEKNFKEEVTRQMNGVMDPYMNEFISTVKVDIECLEYKFQENLPAYVNLFMRDNMCINFSH